MHWKWTTLLICLYGIIKEFRPATPFLTPYLVSTKNISSHEVYTQIYPCWTYSYMFALIPTFILTDALRYKPVIVLEASTLAATWALLVWGQSIWQMQLMQVCFGISSAAEVAYFSYLYAVVDARHYKRVTSFTRASALVGKLFAFALAQVLVSAQLGTYLLLNQITFGATCVVTVIALLLPQTRKEKKKMIERANVGPPNETGVSMLEPSNLNFMKEEKMLRREKLRSACCGWVDDIKYQLRACIQDSAVLKWSLWWTMASCGVYQTCNYVQVLWFTMQSNPNRVDNGVVEFINTLAGAVLTFAVQYLTVDWTTTVGETALVLSSLTIAFCLLLMSNTHTVFFAYASYIVVMAIYHALITIASTCIASRLDILRHGFVFGINTFFAVCLQTLITLVVVEDHFVQLQIDQQFAVYSVYFGFASLLLAFVVTAGRAGLFSHGRVVQKRDGN